MERDGTVEDWKNDGLLLAIDDDFAATDFPRQKRILLVGLEFSKNLTSNTTGYSNKFSSKMHLDVGGRVAPVSFGEAVRAFLNDLGHELFLMLAASLLAAHVVAIITTRFALQNRASFGARGGKGGGGFTATGGLLIVALVLSVGIALTRTQHTNELLPHTHDTHLQEE